MSEDEIDSPSAIGFIRLAWEYADAARSLQDAKRTEQNPRASYHPVGFLYCHAMELALKGMLLASDPTDDVERHGHNLQSLYREVAASGSTASEVLMTTSEHVRQQWRLYHRGGAERRRGKLIQLFSQEELYEIADIPTNAMIGEQLPKPRDQVAWLSQRHHRHGGTFRYLKLGNDNVPSSQLTSPNEVIPFFSAYLAVAYIHDQTKAGAFAQENED
ncbi:MAG: hypothetical protein AAGB05_12530 [Pseudomonadota bacterium]